MEDATIGESTMLPEPLSVLWQWDNSIGGHAPKFPPRPAILLEYRDVKRRGQPPRREGLVLYAYRNANIQWRIGMEWAYMSELRPMDRPPTPDSRQQT